MPSLIFLLHINDLPSVVSSTITLFADDCLISIHIKKQYQNTLKNTNICLRTGVTHGLCVLTLSSAILCEYLGHTTKHFSDKH